MPGATQPNQYEVPRQLESILLDFTVSVLVEQPSDLLDYAVNYFTRVRDCQQDGSGSISNARTPDSDDGMLTDEEPEVRPYMGARRKSVFAEAYNPEEDEDDGEVVVHPKSDSQRKRLYEAVKNTLLFRALDHEQMNEVLDAMFERKVSTQDYVIKQGDDGDNFYVIESGVYNILVGSEGETPKLVGNYNNCGSFGELALMYNQPRAATIQAISDGLLWGMDRQTFRKMVLRAAFKKRKLYESLLESVDILKHLNAYERMNLSDALVSKTYPAGHVIIAQGDNADGMYFIEDGSVRVTVTKDGQMEEKSPPNPDDIKVLKPLTRGEYFGERALITNEPRAATITAESSCRVAFLDREAFERLLGPCKESMHERFSVYEQEIAGVMGAVSMSGVR